MEPQNTQPLWIHSETRTWYDKNMENKTCAIAYFIKIN